MTWRTVVAAHRAKIDYSMGYMVVRGRETHRIFLDEVGTVIIESTAVSLTAAWVSECIRRKIKIIFCDGKHDPAGEVLPYRGSGGTSRQVRNQARWTQERKDAVWACIAAEKIRQQAAVLAGYGCGAEAEKLLAYAAAVQPGDKDNREGHAAKVYFHTLWGKGFSRRHEDARNGALNYGYAVLLSACNREIAAAGYLTQLGIFHDNVFNPFNLGSDVMEPFRPLIDRYVLQLRSDDFGPEEKRGTAAVLHRTVRAGGKRVLAGQAVSMGCRRVLEAMETGELDELRKPWYEVPIYESDDSF